MIFEKNISCPDLSLKELNKRISSTESVNLYQKFCELLDCAIISHSKKKIQLYQHIDFRLIEIQNMILTIIQETTEEVLSTNSSLTTREKLNKLTVLRQEIVLFKEFIESRLQLKYGDGNLVQYPIPTSIHLQKVFKNQLEDISRSISTITAESNEKSQNRLEFVMAQDNNRNKNLLGSFAQSKICARAEAEKRTIVPKPTSLHKLM